jgi:hypothetical protein
MVLLLASLPRFVHDLFNSRKSIFSENAVLKKKARSTCGEPARNVRREALDKFLLLGRDQIQGILEEYVAFHNTQRPHQRIHQQIPKPGEAERTSGPIRKSAVLGGLHHHYYRKAA